MPININGRSAAGRQAADEAMQAALVAHAANPTPESHAELVRLYEESTGFRGGCSACRNGRNLFIKGLSAIAQGDKQGGLAQMKGAFSSVGFKLDRLKNALKL